MGFTAQDGQIRKGLDWLREHQEKSGLWRVSYMKPEEKEKETAKAREMKLWVRLAACRAFRRFYGLEKIVPRMDDRIFGGEATKQIKSAIRSLKK